MLVTDLRGPNGLLELTECMTLHTGADLGELVPPGRGQAEEGRWPGTPGLRLHSSHGHCRRAQRQDCGPPLAWTEL